MALGTTPQTNAGTGLTPFWISGIINEARSQAYAFEAQAGQRLEYETKDDICIWVYTPDNQLIDPKDIPATGKYIIQLAVPQGSKTFELVVRLETTAGAKAKPSSPPPFQPDFSRANFPKKTCGDQKPTDPDAYPVKFYPVYIPLTQSNLTQAQSKFCRDAYGRLYPILKKESVQIASFTDLAKAEKFAQFVSADLKNAAVGPPTPVSQ